MRLLGAILLAAGALGCVERHEEDGRAEASPLEAGRPPSGQVIDATLARFRSVLATLSPLDAPAGAPVAQVALPSSAREPVALADVPSGTSVRFALEGASDALLVTRSNVAVAPSALGPGVDVLYRTAPTGMEDFVLFPAPPSERRLSYRLEVPVAAGLRLVERTLEVLDESGTPRLRMAPPYVVDARGARRAVDVTVRGCDFDRDPRPPWHRPITPAGATTCSVELRWEGEGLAYPVAVDPAWTSTKGTMVTGRQLNGYRPMNGGVVGGLVLLSTGLALAVAGAGAAGPLASAELFDPSSETWSVTGGLSGGMPTPAVSAFGQGRALVVGNGPASTYDAATGLWTPVTLATGDAGGTAPLADGRVLITGVQASQVFDPTTGKVTLTGSFGALRHAYCLGRLGDGRVLVAGGWNDSTLEQTLRTTELFDPGSGGWSPGPPMALPRDLHTCTPLPDGKLLVAGGEGTNESYRTSETFDPVSNTWSPLLSYPTRHMHHGASAGPGGRVVLSGGEIGVMESGAELYDPSLGRWLSAGALLTPRGYHAQVTLPSGDVLVAGGIDNNWGILGSSEIFRALTGGASCTDDGQCPTGHCADGVCCDQTCAAPCYACSAAKKGGGPDGVCGPVAEGPEPSGRCVALAAETCATDGRCNGSGACSFHPKGTSCAPLACENAVLSQSACDGAGSCVPETTSCGAFACATNASCGAGPCSTDADCAPAFACAAGACVPRKPVCDGDHTLVAADGKAEDCAPYKCAGSQCVRRCNSAIACMDGYVCNRVGACVLPEDAVSVAAESPFGGCRVARGPGGARNPARWLVALAFLPFLRRLRRRGRVR